MRSRWWWPSVGLAVSRARFARTMAPAVRRREPGAAPRGASGAAGMSGGAGSGAGGFRALVGRFRAAVVQRREPAAAAAAARARVAAARRQQQWRRAGHGRQQHQRNPAVASSAGPLDSPTLNGGTTGGGAEQTVTASTYAQLKMYAESATPYVILVQSTISNGANGARSTSNPTNRLLASAPPASCLAWASTSATPTTSSFKTCASR